ncbi:surfactin synthase thioesterase subunit [Desmospora activa DSM 45169]|uniref:Surfactin synthase thioesterase subunit n=1 Tax=Desmospora activa DSM 45169 TaxID=1121389 RepID=A0A2T4ZAC6_9BACL|nr:surfactin synthase thioesterase subunit [Desmospora activa DSM 45169]
MRADMKIHTGNWIKKLNHPLNPSYHLFCFPYAGGGSWAYYSWKEHLSLRVGLYSIMLPGREERTAEPPVTSIQELVNKLGPAMLSYLHQPYVFFGHSMGALVAFELARYLMNVGAPAPVHLFLSAFPAPHLLLPKDMDQYRLSDDDFIDHVKKLGGIPEEVWRHRELVDMVLPLIRSDFRLFQTYQYQEGTPLPCGITVFGGMDDQEIPMENLSAWEKHSGEAFKLQMFTGGAFLLI